MAPQHLESGQQTNVTASQAEPAQIRGWNFNLLNSGVFNHDTRLLQDEFHHQIAEALIGKASPKAPERE